MTNWVPRPPGADGDELPVVAVKRIEEQFKQAMRDLPVWENMRYVERAPFTPEESGAFLAMRAWAEQFYPDEVGASRADDDVVVTIADRRR
jgi:hypothetical protein